MGARPRARSGPCAARARTGAAVAQHEFTSGVPTPGAERVRMNLYFFRYAPAPPQSDVEVVIERFQYLPVAPAARALGAARWRSRVSARVRRRARSGPTRRCRSTSATRGEASRASPAVPVHAHHADRGRLSVDCRRKGAGSFRRAGVPAVRAVRRRRPARARPCSASRRPPTAASGRGCAAPALRALPPRRVREHSRRGPARRSRSSRRCRAARTTPCCSPRSAAAPLAYRDDRFDALTGRAACPSPRSSSRSRRRQAAVILARHPRRRPGSRAGRRAPRRSPRACRT